MKRLVLTCLAISMLCSVHAQMLVDTLIRSEDLIRKVLLGGDDVKVGNIKYTGYLGASGYFEDRNNVFAIDRGVVLSTGAVSSGSGPNSKANKSENNRTQGDEDLTALAKKATFDAAVLEFDFVPLSNKVSFEYVFASEEYPEFTGSRYNDVFAFFISGPSIDGQKNMAVVPNTNEIVSINSISQFKNTDYFVNNNAWKLNGKKKHDVGLGVLNQDLLKTSEFDGMTVVLTAQTNVIPFKKYHFKMAIADVSDARYNSAVYLKGGSFKAELDTTASEEFLTNIDVIKEEVDIDAILNDESGLAAEFTSKGLSYIDEKPKNVVRSRGIVPKKLPKEYENKTESEPTFSTAKDIKTENEEVSSEMTLMLPAYFEAINFENGSAELSTHAQNALTVLAQMLKATSAAQVKLSGHTCDNGSNQDNLVLSQSRATAVKAFLVKNGIGEERIQLNYFGESQPMMSNFSNKGKEQNRRVEILLVKK